MSDKIFSDDNLRRINKRIIDANVPGPYYILVNKKPVSVNVNDWSEWFHSEDRIIGRTNVNSLMVSTVFVGLDHNLGFSGNPLLFETMIFHAAGTKKQYDYQERYETYEQAKAGHEKAVKILKENIQNE